MIKKSESQVVDTTDINRSRLLNLVNGNWDPYLLPAKYIVGDDLNVRVYLDTNWDLVRHDIHVLLYSTRMR